MLFRSARVYGDAWVFGWFPQCVRSDGYTFVRVPTKTGDPVVIAGCQYRTVADYRLHTDEYGDEAKKAETMLILSFLEAQWDARFVKATDPALCEEKG